GLLGGEKGRPVLNRTGYLPFAPLRAVAPSGGPFGRASFGWAAFKGGPLFSRRFAPIIANNSTHRRQIALYKLATAASSASPLVAAPRQASSRPRLAARRGCARRRDTPPLNLAD